MLPTWWPRDFGPAAPVPKRPPAPASRPTPGAGAVSPGPSRDASRVRPRVTPSSLRRLDPGDHHGASERGLVDAPGSGDPERGILQVRAGQVRSGLPDHAGEPWLH